MEDSLVTVIVPIYNAEKYLDKCINSIVTQSYKKLEIILVNDGSSDLSKDICEKYAQNDIRIKFIDKKNSGVSDTRNIAINKALGEYILFADSDDWLESDMIELMVSSAKANNSDIVICEFKNFYEDENRTEAMKLKDYSDYSFVDLISDESTQYGGFPWNKLIRRDCIKNNYHIDVHYYENLLFFLENSNLETRYSVVHKPLYNYCINNGSALHSKNYSIKKVSTLDALLYVIDLVPEKYKDFYKFLFVCRYYENYYHLSFLKQEKEKIVKYERNTNEFFNEIIKSDKLTIKQKMKLFIVHRLTWMYFIIKKIKK